MPALTEEQRKARHCEYQKKYREKQKAQRERERQEQAAEKAALLDSLPDPAIQDAVAAAVINERYGFGIIEGVQHGEKRVVILEHISQGCAETRYRVKEVSYTFFPSRADAVEYCKKNAKRMKYYF